MTLMHKLIRPLALLAFIPAIPASNARAGTTDSQPNLISDAPVLAQRTDTSPIDSLGIFSTNTSPVWVSHEGPGTATIDKDAGGAISGASMTAGLAIPTGARSSVDAPGMCAGSSDSRLDGPEVSFALAHAGGPASGCGGGGGGGAAGPYGADNGPLGILSADSRPISAAMGVIAVGSLAAAWGWKLRRGVAPHST
jgi:hypothetical protein